MVAGAQDGGHHVQAVKLERVRVAPEVEELGIVDHARLERLDADREAQVRGGDLPHTAEDHHGPRGHHLGQLGHDEWLKLRAGRVIGENWSSNPL